MQRLGLPPPPWIVGHRGVREEVPENTVDSLRAAVAQGADMVEIDLQLTSDGQLVVFHDRTIAVAGGTLEPIGRLTLEEVRRCRPIWRPVVHSHGGRPRDYRVPTLAEVLTAAPPSLPLNLEVKRYAADEDPAPLIAALGREIAGHDRILVSSFDAELLEAVRERLPDLPLAPLGRRTAVLPELVELARRLGAVSIHLDRRLAGALAGGSLLGDSGAPEWPILAYTVNRAEEARQLLHQGVSGLFTDHPGALRRRLEEPE